MIEELGIRKGFIWNLHLQQIGNPVLHHDHVLVAQRFAFDVTGLHLLLEFHFGNENDLLLEVGLETFGLPLIDEMHGELVEVLAFVSLRKFSDDF